MGDLKTHCRNVAYYSRKIFSDDTNLYAAALLHDIGKIKIPRHFFNAQKLSKYDFEVIIRHSQEGANLLKEMGYCDEVIQAVLHHHERWDGNGYPDGLKGEKIPVYSRVIAIADTFDMLTSFKYFPLNVVLKEISYSAGTLFDPNMVEIFLEVQERRVAID